MQEQSEKTSMSDEPVRPFARLTARSVSLEEAQRLGLNDGISVDFITISTEPMELH